MLLPCYRSLSLFKQFLTGNQVLGNPVPHISFVSFYFANYSKPRLVTWLCNLHVTHNLLRERYDELYLWSFYEWLVDEVQPSWLYFIEKLTETVSNVQ